MENQNLVEGQLTIIDDEGNEKLCQILFTLESEEFGKKYVVFYEISELSDTEDDEEINKTTVGTSGPLIFNSSSLQLVAKTLTNATAAKVRPFQKFVFFIFDNN